MAALKTYNDSAVTYDSAVVSYRGDDLEVTIFRDFITGDQLRATDVNEYLMNQSLMTFESEEARSEQLSGVEARGMVSFIENTNELSFFNASIWDRLAYSSDVVAVDLSSIQKTLYMR